jgi:hypothetical protein
MPVKYDLDKMLREIEEDEQVCVNFMKTVSQDKIHEMMIKNLKKRKAKQG